VAARRIRTEVSIDTFVQWLRRARKQLNCSTTLKRRVPNAGSISGSNSAQRSPNSILSNAPSSSETLTLAGAVDLAVRQNLDIQIANIGH